MNEIDLPFKVGEVVETKSFLVGYRGAWFQCKILEIYMLKGNLFYKLEYVNYPDEAPHETKVFEKPRGGKKNHLMIRPTYPPVYHESEVLKLKRHLDEPLVVVHGSWKVGDLVDWCKDDCYWSGKIVELMDNDAVQIDLFPKPVGEGSTYEGLCEDLRPSLEWSLEDGWKVPFTMKDGKRRQCAKLITPIKTEDTKHDVKGNGGLKSTQEVKSNGGLKLNIMESDSIEAAVLDIEELIVRIKWLKRKLNPDVGESCWKYEDHIASSSRM
ncbi:hypothetical protein V5N11_026847 [Cardamine amara subsp. amara]|uniref:Agenet domain-containing protein n=1 Tax=Cardamine amara subsp. amara TaxID=228776 RepID=A0ABD0ZUN4_CARAN